MHSGDRGIDKLILVHIAARVLRCSPRTVRRRILKGKIPAIRIGRRCWGIRFSVLRQLKGGVYAGY
jgi:excisionase family DNA binding protein